ncbi:MAG TPA: glycosyltransferase family 4 protein [Candidatus Berkiella sp.]|nr:glycosyltransferase family 4 protein [Candidatus Berkiella sp.]
MRVLFTSPMIMHPAASGPHLRIENSIKALAKVSDLHVMSRVAPHVLGGAQAIKHYQNLAPTFTFAPSVDKLSSWRTFRRMQMVARKVWVNDAKAIVQYARKHQLKVVWFGYGNISYPLIKQVRQLAPELFLVCDTDSVWSRFIFRELPFIDDENEKQRVLKESQAKELEEKDWVQLCDITTAVSEVDATYYRYLTSQKEKVALFSNVLDINQYLAPIAPPPHLKKPAIYLAGSFGKPTSAMNRAADWLIQGILPLVKRQIPDVHCYIVGNHSDVSYGHLKDPSITVTGRLESVLPYLKNIDVALTPLQFESGTRFKILEAAACKTPMVSTTLGAEGIPVEQGKHILLADSSEDFAAAIVKLIQDKAYAATLADNSFQLVAKDYGLEQLAREATAILSRVTL